MRKVLEKGVFERAVHGLPQGFYRAVTTCGEAATSSASSSSSHL